MSPAKLTLPKVRLPKLAPLRGATVFCWIRGYSPATCGQVAGENPRLIVFQPFGLSSAKLSPAKLLEGGRIFGLRADLPLQAERQSAFIGVSRPEWHLLQLESMHLKQIGNQIPTCRWARGSLCLALLYLCFAAPLGAMTLPPGFTEEDFGSLWTEPVGLAFETSPLGANRVYAWERAGRVWVLENGVNSFIPLLDIRDEVGAYRDYGMLGFALDPNFRQNGYIYVSYVVDRHHLRHAGTPEYDPAANEYLAATIGRVTRYTARASDGFRTVDPASRKVLVGETIGTGIPILHGSHGPGHMVFGTDGTLLVAVGDAASWEEMDDGGPDGGSYAVQGLADGIIQPKEDVGAFRAQMVDSLNGKILRLDPATGDGVASNPFFEAAQPRAAKSRVWALGLRNPYRITLRPETGSHLASDGNPGVIVLGDVGQETWEEIDVITGGGQNCGWPLFEGLQAEPEYGASPAENLDAPNPLGGFFKFKDLLVQETLGTPSWPNPKNASQQVPASLRFMHGRPVIEAGRDEVLGGPVRAPTFNGTMATETKIGTPGSPVGGEQFLANASTGGVFYQGTDFPASYRGTYFHADYGQGWIKNIVFDANHRPVQVNHFATGGHPVFVASHPTQGALYYVDMTIPVVKKITYAPSGNLPPSAVAKANVTSGGATLPVQFSSAGSSDPEGKPLTYLWQFGDGTTSTAANPAHTFTAASATRREVHLTVTDAAGGTAQASVAVFVNHTLPQVEITSPIQGTKYPLTGDTEYRLTRRVIEAPNHPTSTRWKVFLRHENHEHGEPAMESAEAAATLSPVHSETEEYSYRILLTVTDDLGAVVEREVRLFPNAANAAPQAAWSTVSQARRTGAGPLVLDFAATVSDTDSTGVEGGELRVVCSTLDPLSILAEGRAPGQIDFDGTDVFHGGMKVGVAAAGAGSLIVTFNDAVTPMIARAILRRVTGDFATDGPRTLTLTLTDGDGGTSAPQVLTMNVADDAPVTLTTAAMLGHQVPGEPAGTTFAKLGAVSAGGFSGSLKIGTKVAPALFDAGGLVRVRVGDAALGLTAKIARLNPPSGDAALATLVLGAGVTASNDTVLLAGVSGGTLRVAAREGLPFSNSGLLLKSFLSIDGVTDSSGAIFFLAKLQGASVTVADDTALCAARPDGSVRLLVRKGTLMGTAKISVIGTLAGGAGTLAEGRWRMDGQTIGARLSLTSGRQLLCAIRADAGSPQDWTYLAGAGDFNDELAGAKIRSFGLPGFSADGVAAMAIFHTAEGGPTGASDRAIFARDNAGFSVLARKGSNAADPVTVQYRSFGEPVAGAGGKTAFTGWAGPAGGAASLGVWYAPAGELPKRIAVSRGMAPGGGRFNGFTSLALPNGASSGPAFTASLLLDAAAGVTASNNLGLWAADSAGALSLLLRTGKKVLVQGKERFVKSFTALAAVPGALGAAAGYDGSRFHVAVSFTDGSSAIVKIPAP